jgi:hypothetical protein
MLPFDVVREVFSKTLIIDFKEKGAADKSEDYGDKSPGEILDLKAKELVTSGKVKTYQEAIQQVLREDETLAKDYAGDKGKVYTVR